MEILVIESKTLWTTGCNNNRYYLLYGYNPLSTSLLFLNFTQAWKEVTLAPTSKISQL